MTGSSSPPPGVRQTARLPPRGEPTKRSVTDYPTSAFNRRLFRYLGATPYGRPHWPKRSVYGGYADLSRGPPVVRVGGGGTTTNEIAASSPGWPLRDVTLSGGPHVARIGDHVVTRTAVRLPSGNLGLGRLRRTQDSANIFGLRRTVCSDHRCGSSTGRWSRRCVHGTVGDLGVTASAWHSAGGSDGRTAA